MSTALALAQGSGSPTGGGAGTASGMDDRGGLVAAARCLALDAAAMAAVAALDARGIASIVLKGPAMANRLYPEDPGLRTYRDVDLFVAPGTFAAAGRTLFDLGYRPAVPGARADDLLWHEREWRAPGPAALTIDLHRSFAGVEDAERFWTTLWTTADRLHLAGSLVAVPDAAAAALLLALHAAAPGSSTQPVADLQRALAILPEATWHAAAILARASGSDAACAVGLRLVPGGSDLARRLDLPTAATPITWLRARPHGRAAFALAKLAAVPSTRGRLRLLVRRLVPSPASMRAGGGLADAGPERLAGAYLARLATLAAGTPRGIRELRNATVAARDTGGTPSRGRPPLRHVALRAVRRRDVRALRASLWARQALGQVRRQLPGADLRGVAVRPAPPSGPNGGPVVAAVLRGSGATCLEGALVRQAWQASQGVHRELVIGVSVPGPGFHAHAWLAGETGAQHHGLVEILRRPPAPVRGGVAPAGQGRNGRHRSARSSR